MRLIIAGSRGFSDKELLVETLERFLDEHNEGKLPTEVLCGEARGADTLGKEWARMHGIPVTSYPAQWQEYGKGAGLRRNVEMARQASACIIFWDGKSRGSQHMISTAQLYNLKLEVVLHDSC